MCVNSKITDFNLFQVLSCVTTLLQTDKEVKVRQAALVVIKLLIKNLSHNTVKVPKSILVHMIMHLAFLYI